MKKYLAVFLAIMMTCMLIPSFAFAEDGMSQEQNMNETIISNSSLENNQIIENDITNNEIEFTNMPENQAQNTSTKTIVENNEIITENIDEDEIAVENVKNLLTWDYIKNGNIGKYGTNWVIKNLYLPTTSDIYQGISIAWESDNPAISSDGSITRPLNEESDTGRITLKATITKGNASSIAEIQNIKVKKITDTEIKIAKDKEWLQTNWSQQQELNEIKKDLDLPLRGENGSSIIWQSSNESVLKVIKDKATVFRPDVDSTPSKIILTATLKKEDWRDGNFEEAVQLQLTVLPRDSEEEKEKNEKLRIINELVEKLDLPQQVTYANQDEVTCKIQSVRKLIAQAYQAALDSGLMEREIDSYPAYAEYKSAELSLLKLNKVITISVVNVKKEGTNYIADPFSYYLPKTKILISGENEESNFIKTALEELKEVEKVNGDFYSTLSFKIKNEDVEVEVGPENGYEWEYALNGVPCGKCSMLNGNKYIIDDGDSIVFYYIKEGDNQFIKEEYTSPLPENKEIDYNFAKTTEADYLWLTTDKILLENLDIKNIETDLKLPLKGHNGSEISWNSSNTDIVTEEGKVFRPNKLESDEVITLTATLSKWGQPDIEKVFKVTVKALKSSYGEKTIAYAKDLLVINNKDAITENIPLSTIGFGGTSIKWSSSDESIIDNQGVVARSNLDKKVVLTATISLGEYSTTKDFTLTVLAKATNDEAVVAYDKEALIFSKIKGKNIDENNVISNLLLPKTGVQGSSIEWSSEDKNTISDEGIVTRKAIGQGDVTVNLTATLKKGNAKEVVVFKLTVPELTSKSVSLQLAEKALQELPEPLDINVKNRDSVTEAFGTAKRLVEDAENLGINSKDILGIEQLTNVEKKLQRLPIEMTFSIIGAKVSNQKITERVWFVRKSKLLIPSSTNLSDITEAIINGYDSVRPNSGSSYYGSIMGLSQFDAGKGSGWIFGGNGEGIDTGQAVIASIPGNGSIAYWFYIGDTDNSELSKNYEAWDYKEAFEKEKTVDIDLTVKADFTKINNIINKAETLKKSDYRNYGVWKDSWQEMQDKLAYAKRVANISTALNYEVDDALEALNKSLESLEPIKNDKVQLQAKIEKAQQLKKEDYYENNWKNLQDSIRNAIIIANDQYALELSVNEAIKQLDVAISRLLPKNQEDKTQLQKALDQYGMYNKKEYSFIVWNRVEKIFNEAKVVFENPSATEIEINVAVKNLYDSYTYLTKLENTTAKLANVAYNAQKDFEGTKDAWNILEMIRMGKPDCIDEKGYKAGITELIQSKKSSVTDLERTAIVLTALGYDVSNIIDQNGESINLISKIMNNDFENLGLNASAFALLAVDSGKYEIKEDINFNREKIINFLIENKNEDGGWSLYKGGASDIDMTAMVISALAPYYNKNIKGLDYALESSIGYLNENLNYAKPDKGTGNSNSIAMAVIAYVALPQVNDNYRLKYCMEYGGLGHYVTEDGYLGFTDEMSRNNLSTEQGVRAYIAYTHFCERGNRPYYFYQSEKPTKLLELKAVKLPQIKTNLSNKIVKQSEVKFTATAIDSDGKKLPVSVKFKNMEISSDGNNYTLNLEKGLNVVELSTVNEYGFEKNESYTLIYEAPDSETQIKKIINVQFELIGDLKHGTSSHKKNQIWIPKTVVSCPENSSVKYVTEKMLIKNNIDFISSGVYISKINGLAEFDNGPNSGWMYRHNGKIADKGYAERLLKEGDRIKWFYTDDYTKETGYEGGWDAVNKSRVKDTGLTEVKAKDKVTITMQIESKSDFTGTAKASVSSSELKSALDKALNNAKKVEKDIKKNVTPEVQLDVKADNKVTAIETIMTTASVKELTKAESALSVITPIGNIILDNKVLAEITKLASGKELILKTVRIDPTAFDKNIVDITEAQKKTAENNIIYDVSIFSDNKKLTNFDGRQLSISLPYSLKIGEKASGVTVWYLDSLGQLTKLISTYNEKTKLVTFDINHLSCFMIGYEKKEISKFVDVKQGDWYYDYVLYLVDKGIIKGKTTTIFKPNENITRAEFVQILYGMAKYDAVVSDSAITVDSVNNDGNKVEKVFYDVNKTDWYAKAVEWAYQNGVIKGIQTANGNMNFAPNANITRQDMAVMLQNYIEKVDKNIMTEKNPKVCFVDDAKIDTYAKDAVTMMHKQGIINGIKEANGGYKFEPKVKATRAEAASIISKYLR